VHSWGRGAACAATPRHFPERDHMLWTILIIVLIVLVVMAVLGRGRFARR
jgi:hypothetical protein